MRRYNNKKQHTLLLTVACLALGTTISAIAEEPEITFESLLEEMADAEAISRFPAPFYYCKQSSSYNRLAVKPEDSEGWFSNSDNTGIIRTEENQGRLERVLMESDGPGVITRIWMPHMREDQETPPMDINTVIRFYMDGAEEPSIEANVHDLITGRNFIKPPFAYISLNAGVVYLPIPFANGCKITIDQDPFYYIINYRAYEAGAKVQSFKMDQYEMARPILGRIGRMLLEPENSTTGKRAQITGILKAGTKKTTVLAKGPAAVQHLEVKLPPEVDDQVLRSVILRIQFDDEETVWATLGDFFGCGPGLNPFSGRYRQVSTDGTLLCRWVMPYKKSGRITLENLGDSDVSVDLHAVTGNYDWDDLSMYFRANWQNEYPLPTRPRKDWNYIEAKGRGVYVGDTLTVMNPVVGWWGEGDEKIWVDDDIFPSHFGTGTEDYYGYAWGGRGTTYYAWPFHAQVLAGSMKTYGYNVQTRTRTLDAIPFKSRISVNMEVWHPQDVETAYTVGTYWYAFPGVEHNREASPSEARRVIPRPPEISEKYLEALKNEAAQTPNTSSKIANAIEFEDLIATKQSEGVTISKRQVAALKWSNKQQLLVTGTKKGDFVEFEIPTNNTEPSRLIFHGTYGPRYGKCRIFVQGNPVGDIHDFHAASFVKTGPISLGEFIPSNGKFTVRFEAADTPETEDKGITIAGLDCLVLEKEKRDPNVIIIFTDDMGFGDIGVNGATGYATPHIDRMAAEGMQFPEFYTGRSVCSPSRASLMTGCYPLRVGVNNNFGPRSNNGLHPEEMTIADVVKQKDYATAMYGKWHLGHLPEFLPTKQGFDEWYGLPYSNDMWPFHPDSRYDFPDLPLMEGETILEYNSDQTKLTTEYTKRTVRFIETHTDEPFFIYLAHAMPHVPLYASTKFSGKSKRGLYGDVVEEIDWSVGQILGSLKRLGLDEHTLVIFTSDNGPWLLYGDHGGSAGPFREGKGTMFEGGMRVPCVMRWPGKIPAGKVCNELASSIDLLPTIAGLVHAPLPERKIDGKDIWSLMSGEPKAKTPHEAFFYYYSKHLQAVRSDKWKLHFAHSYKMVTEVGIDGSPGTRGTENIELSLFNMETDQGETTNLADKYPEVVDRLRKLADTMSSDLGDSGTNKSGPGIRELAWGKDGKPTERKKR